jgi:hypothetical protein
VIPYKPKSIVIYAGSRDLHIKEGKPKDVLKMFIKFRESVRAKLPKTKIFYLSMKPSIEKWKTIHLDKEANGLIEEYAKRTENVEFIDIWTPMVSKSSPPTTKYFVKDLNHPSIDGFNL